MTITITTGIKAVMMTEASPSLLDIAMRSDKNCSQSGKLCAEHRKKSVTSSMIWLRLSMTYVKEVNPNNPVLKIKSNIIAILISALAPATSSAFFFSSSTYNNGRGREGCREGEGEGGIEKGAMNKHVHK